MGKLYKYFLCQNYNINRMRIKLLRYNENDFI